MADGEARRSQRAEAVAPHVDRPAAGDPVDQFGDVIGESLDRQGPAGVGRVPVSLQFHTEHPPTVGEPGEDVAEAALEREDATVQGHERRSVYVPVLLVPDGDVVDRFERHVSFDGTRRRNSAVTPLQAHPPPRRGTGAAMATSGTFEGR